MFEAMGWMEWAFVVVSLLLFVSEVLPFSESIKANGIFQGVLNGLKALKDFLAKKPAA